jgi:nucleotide-binding universal stress UspA family protein
MKQPRHLNQIVIATDGSPGSAVAVEEGVWLAKMLDARVTFVTVVRPPLPLLGEPYYQRAVSVDLARARHSLAQAIDVAQERDITFDTDVLQGAPAEAILAFARDCEADLIVLGSRGRGSVVGAVLGSVSAEVVHRADRPVLVARPRAMVHPRARLSASA